MQNDCDQLACLLQFISYVYSRLQKLGLCLVLLKLLDVPGTDHDHIVMDWVKDYNNQSCENNFFKNWWKGIIYIYFTGLHNKLTNSSDVQ